MLNKEKFLSLVSDEKPDTVKRNKERIKNREWLNISQNIALDVLNKIDELKWTKEILAKKMNISIDEVNKICSGKTNLTLDIIVSLQKVLKIKLNV